MGLGPPSSGKPGLAHSLRTSAKQAVAQLMQIDRNRLASRPFRHDISFEDGQVGFHRGASKVPASKEAIGKVGDAISKLSMGG
jgi:hypothetical protein